MLEDSQCPPEGRPCRALWVRMGRVFIQRKVKTYYNNNRPGNYYDNNNNTYVTRFVWVWSYALRQQHALRIFEKKVI
jgi:hypothetical protein